MIVNAAAYTAVDRAESEPDRAQLVNATAAGQLAAAAARAGALADPLSRPTTSSTAKSPSPTPRTTPPRPLNVYGRTSARAKLAIAAAGCRHLILRTSWVHAPGHGNFVRTMLRLAARARRAARGRRPGRRARPAPRLIADVTARASLRLALPAGRSRSGIYHLAAAGETSWHGYARFVVEARASGAAPRLKVAPDSVRPVASADYPHAGPAAAELAARHAQAAHRARRRPAGLAARTSLRHRRRASCRRQRA